MLSNVSGRKARMRRDEKRKETSNPLAWLLLYNFALGKRAPSKCPDA